MRWLAAGLMTIGLAVSAFAQALPYHTDPNAREEQPDLSLVPAIRFLTTADFPPFNYRDSNGALIGFHIDLAKSICDQLAVACTVQAWPWDQVTDALADNQGDALIAGLALNDITAEQFDFSSIYLMLPARFVARRGATPEIDPMALAGTSVAVRAGSAHARYLETYFPDTAQTPFETEILGLEAVRDGEADLFFGDAMRAAYWLNQNLDCCAFAGEAYFSPDYFGPGFTVAVPAGRGAVREAINYALSRLKRDGKLDELYLRWFPISFY